VKKAEQMTGSTFSTEKIDFIETKFRWVVQDAPAFKSEPYLTTAKDYISKINFELAQVAMPQSTIKNYTGTWLDVNKTFYDAEDFGGEVRGNVFLKKIVSEVTANATSNEQKIAAIHNYVKSNVAWNSAARKFTSSSLRKVLDEKKGNSAEINLLLASMLDKADLKASPVLISTRNNGFVREQMAISSQFNYAICMVEYDNKYQLLDATEPLLPADMLPERCLNGRGLVVTKEGPKWVDLVANTKSKTITTITAKLDQEGQLSGQLSMDRAGYQALDFRKKFLLNGEEDYLKEVSKLRPWSISNSQFENVKNITEQFKEKHDVEISSHATVAGDMIYMNPFVLMQKAENPFKLEKREYPVDFGFARDEIYVCKITIPDGYVVEELPKSKVFVLPGNSCKYLYNISVVGNAIMFTSNFQINKSLFTQDEYPSLREYYSQVVAKQSEQVVLKKKLN
jgi:hypothetical protein